MRGLVVCLEQLFFAEVFANVKDRSWDLASKKCMIRFFVVFSAKPVNTEKLGFSAKGLRHGQDRRAWLHSPACYVGPRDSPSFSALSIDQLC